MAHTLLLADDSGTTHRVIELTFAEQGVRVVAVTDGEQAVEKLSTERPDIILAATGLPKLNGYELAAFVKQQASLSGVPVLLLTGAFDTIDEDRLRDCGAAGILVKPFEPGAVLTKVKELLGISGDTSRLASPATGRLITHVDAPRARPPMAASWQPPPPKQLDPLPPSPTARSSAARERPLAPDAPSWDQLRQDTGLGPDAQHVEGPGSGGDYFDQLDAAFDTLDAQLAGKAAPRGRVAPAPPTPRMPAAIDPAMRPAAARDLPTALPPAPEEVEAAWAAAQNSPAVAATAHPPTAPTASGPAAFVPRAPAAPAPAPALAPSAPAHHPPAVTAHVEVESPRVAPPPPVAAPVAPSMPRPEMADAFAALLAAEQGEPINHQQPAMEVNDDVIDRIASRVADKLSHSLLMDHVTRIVSDVAERVVREEIARIRAAAQRKF